MTYGEVRFRLSKLAPGLDLDLLDGWIQDRYAEILDRLPWQRLEKRTTLQSVAEYTTGTLAASNGSQSITGTGTAWTADMTGRMIRIAASNEWYVFTHVSATTGTLDRTFEGTTGTGLAYRINKNVYALPATLRYVEAIESLELGRALHKLSRAELNALAPVRNSYEAPQYYALCLDDASDPPLAQIELYPIPIAFKGFVLDYVGDASASSSSASLLPWMRPAALTKGVQADLAYYFKELALGDRLEGKFDSLVRDMIRTEAYREGPVRLKAEIAPHRIRRWSSARERIVPISS